MKIKSMLTNSVYVFSALLIGIAVCVSVWFFLKEHKDRGIPTHKNSSREHQSGIPINNRVTPAQNPDGNPGEDSLTPEERVAELGKRNFIAMLSEDELATPMRQEFLEAMDSPELLEHLKDMRINGPSFRKWNNFLESQGIPVKREFPEMFRKYFPTGEPEDYDPEMRLKIAELFLADQPVDLTDPTAAAMQRMKVIREFKSKDEQHTPWFYGRFGDGFDGYQLIEREGVESNPTLVWVADVQRNAARIVAAAETAGVDTPETQVSGPSWDLSSVIESPSAFHSETEMPATLDTSEHTSMTDAEIETAIEKSLRPQPPDVLTNQRSDTPDEIQNNLETTLRAQFSSERFERAMDTLEQYGPEEGLRRLKENDPEVAKQIENSRRAGVEQHRNRSRSEDSDKSEEEVSR